jgi:L-lactate utilization protein LutB
VGVTLWKNGKCRLYSLPRLFARTFINPNIKNSEYAVCKNRCNFTIDVRNVIVRSKKEWMKSCLTKKLTLEDILVITEQKLTKKVSLEKSAQQYNISRQTIKKAIHRYRTKLISLYGDDILRKLSYTHVQ